MTTEIVLAVMMTLHGWRGFSPENARMYAEQIAWASGEGAQRAWGPGGAVVSHRLRPMHAAWLLVSGCRPGASRCFGTVRAQQDLVARCWGTCENERASRRSQLWVMRMTFDSVVEFDHALQACGTRENNQIGDVIGHALHGHCATSPALQALAVEVRRVRDLLIARMQAGA